MNRLWMVSYDIGDDRIRAQVHDILNNCGERVQYSVFECWLDSAGVTDLRRQLTDLIETADSVRWYPICAWCRPALFWQGPGHAAEDSEYYLL